MFNTTPPDSPRSQASYASDVTIGSSTEEEVVPDSTSAAMPAFSTRDPASVRNEVLTGDEADGVLPETVHTDPRVQVLGGDAGTADSEVQGSGKKSSNEKDSNEKIDDRVEIADSMRPTRAQHKQLQRHERVLNLKERQLHLKFDKFLKEDEAGELDVDIRTTQEMEALISWLKVGQTVKVFRLRCDFGGMHTTLSEESEDEEQGPGQAKPQKLDVHLFERLLAVCHGIDALDLSECRLAPENYRMLRRFLMQKPCKLESLLFGGQFLRGKEAASLARGLEHNRSLNMLSLSGTATVSSGLKRIIEAVIRNPRIDSLWLENVNGCEEQLPVLRLLLIAGHCTYLGVQHPTGVRIVGRDTRLWNERFEQFCNQLSVNLSLRLLDLSGFDLTDENFKSLIDALKFNKDLEWLELGANKPGSHKAALIKSYLMRNRRAHRDALLPHAAAALDLLAGTVMPDTWPKELSNVLASRMRSATLEQLKKGLDAGFGIPGHKRKRQVSSDAAPSGATGPASGSRQRTPATTATSATAMRNTTDHLAPEKRGE